MNFEDYGFESMRGFVEGNDLPARVIEVQRERYAVVSEQGASWARLRKGVFEQPGAEYPTVGDFVALRFNPLGDSVIGALLPRRTVFLRRDSFSPRGRQAAAANFDDVFIVTSMNGEYNTRRLERYLAQTRESGARPVIVLTKKDVGEAGIFADAVRAAGGAPVHAVSAKTGDGLDALRAYLARGRVIALLGSSGVGKSTLVNALAGGELMKTGAIREDDAHGRHTTTFRRMLMMPCGTGVIDMPGMRELGMWDSADGVRDTFGDIEELAAQCRFRDCTHTREPGCAIRAALGARKLDAARVRNYLTLRAEADATARRAEKQARDKQIAVARRKNRR